MSLGWQCESALLPSNSKPINVDGKSLVGLKALLYDEQQRSTNGKVGDDGHRSARLASSNRKESISNKDKYEPPRNADKGISKKNAQNFTSEKEANVLAALTAKSKLYEEISRGKIQLQSELVNFDDKIEVDVFRVKEQAQFVPPPKPPSMPNPAKRSEPIQTMPQTSSQYDSKYENWRSQAQVSTQPQWNWSTNYGAGSATNTESDRDNNDDYKAHLNQEAVLKRTVEDRLRSEKDNNTSTSSDRPDGSMSEAARVKTQWEKTLNSSARGFLDQAHDDAAAQRAVSTSEGTQKRSLREEKMELIRQKRSRMPN